MITYSDIYEAARKERYSEQLQPITKNFISEVSVYFRDKKGIAAKEEDVFSDVVAKTKKQLENAMTLFNELMLRRRKKILNLVLVAAETGISKQDFDNMFEFEKELFDDLMKCIDVSAKKMREGLSEKGKEVVNEESGDKLVVFLEETDEFLNLNGETMGPYSKGQSDRIPSEIVNILVSEKKCEVIED